MAQADRSCVRSDSYRAALADPGAVVADLIRDVLCAYWEQFGQRPVRIKLPDGVDRIQVQLRPSNADTNYNGLLDVILPRDQAVTLWSGNDMQPADVGSMSRNDVVRRMKNHSRHRDQTYGDRNAQALRFGHGRGRAEHA